MKLKKAPFFPFYFLASLFLIFQILDVITTTIILTMGGIEVNPLGFNPLVIVLKINVALGLFPLAWFSNRYAELYTVKSAGFILFVFFLCLVINSAIIVTMNIFSIIGGWK